VAVREGGTSGVSLLVVLRVERRAGARLPYVPCSRLSCSMLIDGKLTGGMMARGIRTLAL
jgi:hypothetical protein